MGKMCIILFFLIIIFSCENRRKKCWTCTTKIESIDVWEDRDTLSYTTEKCDMTKKEAEEFERLLTKIKLTDNNYKPGIIAITECVEKNTEK